MYRSQFFGYGAFQKQAHILKKLRKHCTKPYDAFFLGHPVHPYRFKKYGLSLILFCVNQTNMMGTVCADLKIIHSNNIGWYLKIIV